MGNERPGEPMGRYLERTAIAWNGGSPVPDGDPGAASKAVADAAGFRHPASAVGDIQGGRRGLPAEFEVRWCGQTLKVDIPPGFPINKIQAEYRLFALPQAISPDQREQSPLLRRRWVRFKKR